MLFDRPSAGRAMKAIRTTLEPPRIFDAGRCVRGKVSRNVRRSIFLVMFTIIIIVTNATMSFAFQYPYWIPNTNVTGVVNVLLAYRPELGPSSVSVRVGATIRSCAFPRNARPSAQTL